MGSLLVLLVILAIVTVLVIITSLVLKKLGYSRRIQQFLKDRLFWNTFIRTSLHSYIKAAFIYFTMMTLLDWSTIFDAAKSLLSITVVLILITLPVFYASVLYRNQEVLKFARINRMIGSLYLDLRHWKMTQLAYTVIFLLRRLIFVILMLAYKE